MGDRESASDCWGLGLGFRLVSPSGVSFEVPADLRDRASDVFDFGFAKAGMVGLQPGRPRPSLLARLMSLPLAGVPAEAEVRGCAGHIGFSCRHWVCLGLLWHWL